MTKNRLENCYMYLRRAENASIRLDRINYLINVVKNAEGLTSSVTLSKMLAERRSLTRELKRCSNEAQEIIEYIYSIRDIELKTIMCLRYLERKSWQEIADILGGNNTESSARMMVNRHFQKERLTAENMSADGGYNRS